MLVSCLMHLKYDLSWIIQNLSANFSFNWMQKWQKVLLGKLKLISGGSESCICMDWNAVQEGRSHFKCSINRLMQLVNALIDTDPQFWRQVKRSDDFCLKKKRQACKPKIAIPTITCRGESMILCGCFPGVFLGLVQFAKYNIMRKYKRKISKLLARKSVKTFKMVYVGRSA